MVLGDLCVCVLHHVNHHYRIYYSSTDLSSTISLCLHLLFSVRTVHVNGETFRIVLACSVETGISKT